MHSAVEIKRVLHDIVLERAAGGVEMPTKQGMYFGPGHFFHSMIASSRAKGIVVCKWIGLAPGSEPDAGQQTHSTLLVSELASGKLLDIADAGPITRERTAALSLLAYELCGKPPPASMGFIGGGHQALTHLHAFLALYPDIRDVYLYELRPRGAAAFREICAGHGIACHVEETPGPVLSKSQLLVTSVPGTSERLGFLDAGLTREDVFICAVDLGRSWDGASLRRAAPAMVTDDLAQTGDLIDKGSFPLRESFAADLPSLAAGAGKSQVDREGRIMFAFAGSAYADLAAAACMIESRRGT